MNLKASQSLKINKDTKYGFAFTEDNKVLIVHSSIVNIWYIISFFLIPLVIASNLNMVSQVRWYELAIDLVILFDIIISFIKAYKTDIRIIRDIRLTAFRYLTGGFIFEILSVLPWLVTGESYQYVYLFKLLRYLQYFRLFYHIQFGLEKLRLMLFSIDKKTVENIVIWIQTAVSALFFIHVVAWLWIFIGRNHSNGWIDASPELTNSDNVQFDAYVPALFFIVTTVTTIGYGDFLPKQTIEMIFVMAIELIGLALFSYFVGVIRSIESSKSSFQMIEQKKNYLIEFLEKVNYGNKKCELPNEILNKAIEHLEDSYQYDIYYLLNIDNFIDQLKPSQKSDILINLLKNRYLDFYNFFNCDEVGFKSHNMFVKEFLTSLSWQTFLPNSPIISRGENLENLYLIESGKVIVSDRENGSEIAVLKKYSFFGDYQIFLDARSNDSFNLI